MKNKKHRYPLRPDAQAFDEIRIKTIPRYKMSGLSGDEWRISARIEFYRKGERVHTEYRHNTEVAARHLAFIYDRAIDDGKAYFAGIAGICDQEGCSQPATIYYKMKEAVCNRCGARSDPQKCYLGETIIVRKFCKTHSIRGDCGLEDCDKNYEVIENE